MTLLANKEAEEVALHHAFSGQRKEIIDGGAEHQTSRIRQHLVRRQVGLRHRHDPGKRREMVVGLWVGGVKPGDVKGQHVMLTLEGREEITADILERDDVLAWAGLGLGHG